jgi:hypothetical protein
MIYSLFSLYVGVLTVKQHCYSDTNCVTVHTFQNEPCKIRVQNGIATAFGHNIPIKQFMYGYDEEWDGNDGVSNELTLFYPGPKNFLTSAILTQYPYANKDENLRWLCEFK